MSESRVPAYILEAQRKGVKKVEVKRRKSLHPEKTDYQTILIPTGIAIKIFSTPIEDLNIHERRIKPIDFFAGSIHEIQKPSVSALSDAELFAELQKRGVQIPTAEPEKETAKRGRKPAAESEVSQPVETPLDNAEIKPESAE
jgi:hypothetical protein